MGLSGIDVTVVLLYAVGVGVIAVLVALYAIWW